jgi:hypothetical protein
MWGDEFMTTEQDIAFKSTLLPCKCGCGEIAGKNAHYLKGHWARGKKHSKEWVAKQSAGLAKAHMRGVFKGCGVKR